MSEITREQAEPFLQRWDALRRDIEAHKGSDLPRLVFEDIIEDVYAAGFSSGIAQERERCARVAEAEEQECETMRSAYANDAYNWSFWERSRKTASSIAVAIRAGDASE